MLIQSHNGILRVFPAIPAIWQAASFTKLRAEGALLVSAVREDGQTTSVAVMAEKGGKVKMLDPFGGRKVKSRANGVTNVHLQDGFVEFKAKAGASVTFTLQ
jgi:alpha-L-fucosidase 2